MKTPTVEPDFHLKRLDIGTSNVDQMEQAQTEGINNKDLTSNDHDSLGNCNSTGPEESFPSVSTRRPGQDERNNLCTENDCDTINLEPTIDHSKTGQKPQQAPATEHSTDTQYSTCETLDNDLDVDGCNLPTNYPSSINKRNRLNVNS